MLTTFLLSLIAGQVPQAKNESLAELRRAYAIEYFDPEAHMRLAKYHHDRGRRLLAFYILEAARRGRFEQPVFDLAFAKVFRGEAPFDDSKEAEARLLTKHADDPKDAKTLFLLSDIYVSRDDWKNAKTHLSKLIALRPEDYENYEALAEVHRREKDNKTAQAVLDGYFAKFPDSARALERKIDPLIKKDPAQALALIEQALQKHPKNASFLFNYGVLMQDGGKLDGAEKAFVKAAELARDSAYIQGWVGRFFLRVRANDEKSLHYYLSAYFADPHFRDTEYAEGRIRKLNYDLATGIVQKAAGDPTKLEKLLIDDNPVVVGMALGKVQNTQTPQHRHRLLAALEHDDPNIRIQAVETMAKIGGPDLDKEISALLSGDDPIKRGLACYLAVKVWKDKGIEAVRPLLMDNAQLVRFDAISALWLDGGETGKRIVREHRGREKHPWLKRMLDGIEKNEQ